MVYLTTKIPKNKKSWAKILMNNKMKKKSKLNIINLEFLNYTL